MLKKKMEQEQDKAVVQEETDPRKKRYALQEPVKKELKYEMDEDQDEENQVVNTLENQNISEIVLGLDNFLAEKDAKSSTKEQTSKLEDFNDEELDDGLDESEDEHQAKSRQRMEEEKAKIILTRKEWDKHFDQN